MMNSGDTGEDEMSPFFRGGDDCGRSGEVSFSVSGGGSGDVDCSLSFVGSAPLGCGVAFVSGGEMTCDGYFPWYFRWGTVW
jgi:hypothetical protein